MENSEFSYHAPCIQCDSKNNVAVYSDGHGHCFGCGHYYSTYEKQEAVMENTNTNLIEGARAARCRMCAGVRVPVPWRVPHCCRPQVCHVVAD